MSDPADVVGRFENSFFSNEVNRFLGSGGELLIKANTRGETAATRMEVGDRLIGMGATHSVEGLGRPPGPEAAHPMPMESGQILKLAERAFKVTEKAARPDGGFTFAFGPLTPHEYSEALEEVSRGAVRIPPGEIPEGTIILSFVDPEPTYTLRTIPGSPEANWRAATKGVRHWNVGIAQSTDFWIASFPSDDIGMLSFLPTSTNVGTIQFGLSLLPGSRTTKRFEPVPCAGPYGETTHHFCLSGYAVGTETLETPFPIGLRTEILFHPVT